MIMKGVCCRIICSRMILQIMIERCLLFLLIICSLFAYWSFLIAYYCLLLLCQTSSFSYCHILPRIPLRFYTRGRGRADYTKHTAPSAMSTTSHLRRRHCLSQTAPVRRVKFAAPRRRIPTANHREYGAIAASRCAPLPSITCSRHSSLRLPPRSSRPPRRPRRRARRTKVRRASRSPPARR